MKNYKIAIFMFCIVSFAKAQMPETDIFLCNISKDSTGYKFSKPENITNREGYDNQPYFTPDNKRILYVSVVDTNQSDIYSYDLEAKVSLQFTNTLVSEYSPAYTPDKNFASVVRVDDDSAQRFYRLPLSNLNDAELIKNTEGIGYSCWLNDSMLAMFILGKANTLQVLNTKNSQLKLIASDIGRCMKLSSDGKKMYFIIKSNPEEWYIYAMDCLNFTLTRIAATLSKSEDFAILPDNNLIMGKDGVLYIFDQVKNWNPIADFKSELNDFYRISVNSDGTLLALVAFTGKKP